MTLDIGKYEGDVFLRVFDIQQGSTMIQGRSSGEYGVEALHIPTRLTVRCSESTNVHLNQQKAIKELNRLLEEKASEQ